MTRRLEFGKADVHYLANLCHNCGACLHACQYAPPHEFAINIPKAMAEVRGQTYADYAWPSALGRLYQRNGLTLSLALAAGLSLFLVLAVALQGGLGRLWGADLGANFYNLFPHNLRSEEHTSELQSPCNLVCRLLLEKKQHLSVDLLSC